jgi:predicted alpha/beta hydrolase family esterase
MSDVPFIIVPGWKGSEPEHWQSLWQEKYGCARVNQDDWLYPKLDSWVNQLDLAIAKVSSPPVLIAHSLGVITVVHWASSSNQKIRGALLVAPPDLEQKDTPSQLFDFFPFPKEKLPFRSILVASSNDPYCTLARASELSHFWGSEWVNLGASGHINVEAGFGFWPEGEKLLHRLLV